MIGWQEARYPFLDEEVREAIRTLPLGDIVDMKLGPMNSCMFAALLLSAYT